MPCGAALIKVSKPLQLLVQLPLGSILQDEVHLLLQGGGREEEGEAETDSVSRKRRKNSIQK